MVFTGTRLTGVIDWDTASPGPRVWDLAYLAYRLIPLTEPGNIEDGPITPSDRARRLSLLCDAYADAGRTGAEGAAASGSLELTGVPAGATEPLPRPADVLPVVVERLHALADFTEARAEEGHEHLRSHVDLYRRDAAWVAAL
jgi:hypothetical protein